MFMMITRYNKRQSMTEDDHINIHGGVSLFLQDLCELQARNRNEVYIVSIHDEYRVVKRNNES